MYILLPPRINYQLAWYIKWGVTNGCFLVAFDRQKDIFLAYIYLPLDTKRGPNINLPMFKVPY